MRKSSRRYCCGVHEALTISSGGMTARLDRLTRQPGENTIWPNCDDLLVLASRRKHLTGAH